MSKKMTTENLAVRMLLDGDEAGLKRLANGLKHQLSVVMGEKCPYCGGSNVCVPMDSPEGVCHDCKEIYDVPVSQHYDADGYRTEDER